MRLFFSAATLDDRIGGLVHPRAAVDPERRARHLAFIVERLAVALVALTMLPVYLAVAGRPGLSGLLVLAGLVTLLASVAVLSATGRMSLAQMASSSALGLALAGAAAASGGPGSPIVLAVCLLPIDASRSFSRPAVLYAGLVAGVVLAALSTVPGFEPGDRSALLHAVVAALATCATILWATRRVASAAARASAAQVADLREQALVQAMGGLAVWQDASGQVHRVSAGAPALLGVPSHHLMGRALFERVHVADRPAYLTAISAAARGRSAAPVEIRLHAGHPSAKPAHVDIAGTGAVPRAPRIVWVELSACAVPGAENEVVTILRDVSDQHHERARLAERDTEIARAAENRSLFIATIGHELRTPLNAIIGFADVLASDRDDAVEPVRRRDYAGIIHAAGTHLLELVDALRDVAQLDNGTFTVTPEPLDMGDLAATCCDFVQLKAQASGVELVRDWPDAMPALQADRRACRQILLNLLSNAVKFTPAGGRVTLSLRRQGANILITVRDSGIGIAEKDLPSLGAPFFRSQSNVAIPEEGMGLGLCVVHRLVGLHRGHLSVATRTGEGTCLTVSLPIEFEGTETKTEPAPIVVIPRLADEKAATQRVIGMPQPETADSEIAHSEIAQPMKRSA